MHHYLAFINYRCGDFTTIYTPTFSWVSYIYTLNKKRYIQQNTVYDMISSHVFDNNIVISAGYYDMYFPKLFPDLSTLNIDEPLQSIDLDLTRSSFINQRKYQNRIKEMKKFILNMMIESKKTCRTIQQSALSSSTQHHKSMTTDTQFNTIMRSVKADTRLYTQKVLKKHQNKLLNARNISTKTQTKNSVTNDARLSQGSNNDIAEYADHPLPEPYRNMLSKGPDYYIEPEFEHI